MVGRENGLEGERKIPKYLKRHMFKIPKLHQNVGIITKCGLWR